jgi:hypothetical protein
MLKIFAGYNVYRRRAAVDYEAIILKGAYHFLMLDRPKEFNHALEKAIRMTSMYNAK